MRSRRHLARSRSAHASALVALCALALAVPAGAASAAPDDPDGEAAVTQRLQDAEVQSLPSQWWWDESGPDTRRARALLRQMTLDEKVDMLHGELNNFYGFYNGPIERLGIPALTMADGPAGVRIAQPGRERPGGHAAARRRSRWRPPGTPRSPSSTGRSPATRPSAPATTCCSPRRSTSPAWRRPAARSRRSARTRCCPGRSARAEIRGIQSHPVVADIKHYNVYTQETNRLSGGNAVVDERALQEIYTRPFAIGVEQGRPGSAMCAFNKVNGVYACENDELLNRDPQGAARLRGLGDERLRRHAQHRAGDPRRPGPGDAGQHRPRRPVRARASSAGRSSTPCAPGRCRSSRIDDAVLRILRPMFALGLFDNPPVVSAAARGRARCGRAPGRRAVAGAAEERRRRRCRCRATSGRSRSSARTPTRVVAGGGSSLVKPTYTVSPLEGIQARAGAGVARPSHVAGADPVTSASLLPGPHPIPSDFLTTRRGENGLRVEYFTEPTFSGADRWTAPSRTSASTAGSSCSGGLNSSSPHFPMQTAVDQHRRRPSAGPARSPPRSTGPTSSPSPPTGARRSRSTVSR